MCGSLSLATCSLLAAAYCKADAAAGAGAEALLLTRLRPHLLRALGLLLQPAL